MGSTARVCRRTTARAVSQVGHEHQFSAHGENTAVCDRIEYAVYGGSLVHRLFVAPDLKRIFAYRREKLREALAADFGTKCL